MPGTAPDCKEKQLAVLPCASRSGSAMLTVGFSWGEFFTIPERGCLSRSAPSQLPCQIWRQTAAAETAALCLEPKGWALCQHSAGREFAPNDLEPLWTLTIG